MKINLFNTGRPYTSAGQRIAWVELEDRRVIFADRDRMVSGVIEAPEEHYIPNDDRRVMTMYDRYFYSPPRAGVEYDTAQELFRHIREQEEIAHG